jgi:Bax protein
MKLDDLLDNTKIDLTEGIGNYARAGALAAATLIGSHHANASPNTATFASAQEHIPEFKKNLVNTILPAVKQHNSQVLQDRTRLQSILKSTHPSPTDKKWMDDQFAHYKAKDNNDLLKKMDVIPPSLAISQAAVESGWGRDPMATQHHVFYGQKSFGDDSNSVQAPTGEKYSKFADVSSTVRSFMNNLNTHPAYQELRDIRAALRKRNAPVTGLALSQGLQKYSTRKGDYVKQIQTVIRQNNFQKLDQSK